MEIHIMTTYVDDIAPQFTALGNNISAIHQALVTLAGQVARVEALAVDLGDPDAFGGELLAPPYVADMLAKALYVAADEPVNR